MILSTAYGGAWKPSLSPLVLIPLSYIPWSAHPLFATVVFTGHTCQHCHGVRVWRRLYHSAAGPLPEDTIAQCKVRAEDTRFRQRNTHPEGKGRDIDHVLVHEHDLLKTATHQKCACTGTRARTRTERDCARARERARERECERANERERKKEKQRERSKRHRHARAASKKKKTHAEGNSAWSASGSTCTA